MLYSVTVYYIEIEYTIIYCMIDSYVLYHIHLLWYTDMHW